MKALIYDTYAGASQMRIVERPIPQPGQGQVRIAVHAAGLNAADWHLYLGDPWLARLSFGLRRPGERVLCKDYAGVVDALGEGVTDLNVGDRVFGEAWRGAGAEFLVTEATRVVAMPVGLTFEEAAALPMVALTAMQGLAQAGMGTANLPDAPRTLVIGASGGVGHAAVQIARILGAGRVVAVCSQRNAAMVADLGADRVIAYDRERVLDCGETFDLVFDTVATTSFRRLRAIMSSRGVYAAAGGVGGGKLLGPAWSVFSPRLVSPFVSQRAVSVSASNSGDDLARVATWVEQEQLRPVLERVYPWEEFAPALERLESKRVAGKLVLRIVP